MINIYKNSQIDNKMIQDLSQDSFEFIILKDKILFEHRSRIQFIKDEFYTFESEKNEFDNGQRWN